MAGFDRDNPTQKSKPILPFSYGEIGFLILSDPVCFRSCQPGLHESYTIQVCLHQNEAATVPRGSGGAEILANVRDRLFFDYFVPKLIREAYVIILQLLGRRRFVMFKPRRILVPTDMSEHSNNATREALDIAKQYGAEVILLHVIKHPVEPCAGQFCISVDLQNQLNAEMMDAARKVIADQLAKMPDSVGVSITTDVRNGVPYDEIVNEAEEKKADLIVISPLGETGLAKYLMGSVTRHVLLSAKCPVLLVR